MGEDVPKKYSRKHPVEEDDHPTKYSRDPLVGWENAELREIMEENRNRKWLMKRLAVVVRWVITLPAFILSVYAMIQLWRSK